MSSVELFRVRIALVQAFLRTNQYDGILLSRADNFAMATGGRRNYVWTFGDLGANSLFVTKDGRTFFVGNTIEEPRAMAEELGDLGCEIRKFLWFENSAAAVVRKEFTGNLVSDDGSLGENVNSKLAALRALLTPPELEKYRRIGALAADSMMAALDTVREGSTEADIAATLIAEGAKRRCHVPVALVACDERIERFRHPLPTQSRLLDRGLEERAVRGYAMVVGCFQREGLVVSLTRFKKTGNVPDYVPGAYKRICAVDAVMQEATQLGKTLGDVFAACQKAYQDLGFPGNEWHNHHQGGATGYAGRTCKGSPGETFPIIDPIWSKHVREIAGVDTEFGMAFAWNPSAKGVKSEDTFILNPDGTQELVSATPALGEVELRSVLGRSTPVVKSGFAE